MAEGQTPSPSVGRYRILGSLGTGGMAEVLLGLVTGPEGFSRPVVLKRILPHLAQKQRFRDMFLDEARIVARIRHRNVVQVHELAEDDHELYMVMEYLEGETVGSILRRLASRRRVFPAALSAHVVAEVCAGLSAAHDLTAPEGHKQAVVHRDISPSNLLVTYQGEVKVIDFGIAFADDRISKTEPGIVKGKHSYMSPEQTRGEPLDARSDLFSVGVVLYELITARHLFKRDNLLDTLNAVCREPIPNLLNFASACPPELEQICMQALNRDRTARIQSASVMRRRLVRVANEAAQGRDLVAWLRQVMESLFADRIEIKRSMLAKIEQGATPTRIPRSETNDEVVLPTVLETLTGPSAASFGSTPVEPAAPPTADNHAPPTTPRPLWPAVTILAALAGAAAIYLSDFEAPPVDPTPAADERLDQVVLRLDTAPPDASIVYEGSDRGPAPVTLQVQRSTVAIEILVRSEGRKPSVFELVPSVDTDVLLRLPVTVDPLPELGARPVDAGPVDVRPRVARPREDPSPAAPAPPRRMKRRRPTDDGYERIDDWRTEPPP